METENYTTRFQTSQSDEKIYQAILHPQEWWSENIEGGTTQLNDLFFYHYKDVHLCKIKIIELVPNRKVVWEVIDNRFNFVKDPKEWIGNKIAFEIKAQETGTVLEFTQYGLTKKYECFEVCKDAWGSYINGSLLSLVETGKGKPNTKENDLNQELIEKWGLPKK